MEVCATTAQFPAVSLHGALERIAKGVSEGLWGQLSSKHVQLCPQSGGVLTEELAEHFKQVYPSMQLRVHANARVLDTHVLWDASTFDPSTAHYYTALTDRMLRLGSDTFSVHAGYREHCSATQFWERVQRLRECVDTASSGRVRVAIEGLYPNSRRPQWVATWNEYEQLLKHQVPFALDLSHLNIVARNEKTWNEKLVEEMLRSPLCCEIHVSANDGASDRHQSLTQPPIWWDLLHRWAPDLKGVVFSEGNLMPRKAFAF